MKRNIIAINSEICNGCGICVESCHEGALQIIDGKAKIVSEFYCDGLGVCIRDCPVGAITIEERKAEAYDEVAVIQRIMKKGEKAMLAHLKHLKNHNKNTFLTQGLQFIEKQELNIDTHSLNAEEPKMACNCPSSMPSSFTAPSVQLLLPIKTQNSSQLTHWPVQLHLLNPIATYFTDADVLLAADCTAFACSNFHQQFLAEKKLAIACPKLDSNKEVYIEKLMTMFESSSINTLTVVIMEVPCCGSLIQLVQMAAQQAKRSVPIKRVIISVQGDLVCENWI
ncbi:MAG: ATP-binding protein [Bacteroidales bacterium]